MMNSSANHDEVAPLPKPADDADTVTSITADSTISSLSFEQFITLPFGIEDYASYGGDDREEDVDVSVFSPTTDTGYQTSSSYHRRFLPVPLRCKRDKDKLISLLSMRCWGAAAVRSRSAEVREELRTEDHYGDGTVPLHHACGCGAPCELVEALLAEHPAAAQVADKLNGNLPIHYASYRSDASARVLQLLLRHYSDGARMTNDCGWLPLHYAASAEAPLQVLRILLDAHPNGAATRDRFGNLPVHHLSCADVEKAELLLKPILDNEEACRAKGKLFGGMLPLHVAAKTAVSTETLQALLNAYPGGAKVTCWDINGRWVESQGPIVAPAQRYALDLLEDQRPPVGTEKEIAEFDEKSDLLFFYNPNLCRYRTEARLDRIINRVSQNNTSGVLAWPLRLSSSNMDLQSTTLSTVDEKMQVVTEFPFLAQDDGKESSMDDPTSKLAKLNKLRSGILRRMAFARKRKRNVVSSFGYDWWRRTEETSDKHDSCERLPLHFSLVLCAPTEMIRKLLEKTPELARVANKQGLLPLHVAAAQGAQQELLELLLQSYPKAAITQDCLGDLPVHHLERYLSKCNIRRIDSVQTIQLLLNCVAHDKQACESTGSVGVVLPLHIAAEYAVEIGIFEKMLETYPHAASQLQVRPGTPNLYALDIIESKRSRDVCASAWNDDFNLKCDLLFAHNPSTSWCLAGSLRLQRLKTRIRNEAECCHPLTAISEKVWVWMCTHGTYESTVKDILDGLPLEALRTMATIKTASGLTVLEGSTIECRQVIRSFLLFAGRYAIEETETPLHVSPTCVVLRARDYGQKTNTDDLHGETARPVVIKFMYSKEQFQREKSSRQRIELVDDKFPPVVEFEEDFDVDRGNNRDMQFRDSIDKFRSHDVANFRYSLVMKEADRTLDDIQKHECPSVNEIRLIMEQIGKALKRLHSKNIVHADIKPMNVVRLNSHITLIDLDSSCLIAGRNSCDGDECAGSKFSSGVLPPEMIYELKDTEETREFLHYWEAEAADFERVEVLRQDFTHEASSNLSKLLDRCRSLNKDPHWRDAFSFYTKRSAVFEELAHGCSSAGDLHDTWFSMNRNACLWRKLKPKKGKSGRMYVVKSFQRGRESPLPYKLIPASVSLDMWSFGILLYSLCTNTSLFVVDRVKDDLDSGEAMEELAKWHLDKVTCQQKLSRVTNELACDLLQSLLQADPKKRPRSMNAVIEHDFFRPVNAKLRLELEMKELKEELLNEAHDLEEFQDLAKSLPFRDLFHRQKWEVVKMKIKEQPSAVPRDILHEACKYGPPHDVLQTVIRVDRTLFRERNGADDLPIHLACFFGADVKAFELLVSMYPESLSIRNGLGETPLDTVQSNLWTYSEQNQAAVIDYLRRYHFPGNFDSSQMTALPLKSAFAKWAHMAPPGSSSATAAIVLSIDISGFKAVNEQAGTDIGDSTIKEYAAQIQDICSSTGSMGSTGLRAIVNVFRMGGDEFAVVVMFEADSYKPSLRQIWNRGVEQMVMDISILEQNGRGRKGKYYTFPRIGCSAGEVSNAEDMMILRLEAEKLQEEVKGVISLTRGESISLHEIREEGALNMKLCDDLLNL